MEIRPGTASFIAAMLKVKPSIMSFSTAQLSVRSPGLGQCLSHTVQTAVWCAREGATCDPTPTFLRMRGGAGAGTHRHPRTQLSEAGTEGCLSIKWAFPGWTRSTHTSCCGKGLGGEGAQRTLRSPTSSTLLCQRGNCTGQPRVWRPEHPSSAKRSEG